MHCYCERAQPARERLGRRRELLMFEYHEDFVRDDIDRFVENPTAQLIQSRPVTLNFIFNININKYSNIQDHRLTAEHTHHKRMRGES